MTTVYAKEFDCVECHRHITRFVHHEGEPLICAECMHMPGWHTDPELVRIFDPWMAMDPGQLFRRNWPWLVMALIMGMGLTGLAIYLAVRLAP